METLEQRQQRKNSWLARVSLKSSMFVENKRHYNKIMKEAEEMFEKENPITKEETIQHNTGNN